MKNNRLFIVSILVLSMILGACAPTQTPVVPDDNQNEPYPVDVEPTQPEDINDSYPAVNPELPLTPDMLVSAEEIAEHADDLNEFAIDLYQKLAGQEGNLIYSPYSIYQAFLMVYAGADGETKAEIADALDFDNENGDRIHQFAAALNQVLTTRPEYLEENAQPLEFTNANSLWLQEDMEVNQIFIDQLTVNYNAGLQLVDFSQPEEARQAINLWVAAQTNDKIKDILPEGTLDELTRLVIANAIYFKAAWSNQFEEANTENLPFHLLDGSEKEVEMMQNDFTGMATSNDSYQAVTLPYEGGNYAMTVIMPFGDFNDFEQNLGDDLDDIFEAIAGNASIQLSFPKFTTESSYALVDQLKALGMNKLFKSGEADLSKINGQRDLYVSNAIHKAIIEVNEEGTEAAASTVLG
ncbi:MAG: serpin family protein, partial [Anaerolineaceae bacterium]|nr:serpin family protein [Anaerolineaceae bacterium]